MGDAGPAPGQTTLSLAPLEWLDRVAVLIPPPRPRRRGSHGVVAPNAPLGAAVTARGGLPRVIPPGTRTPLSAKLLTVP